MPYVTVRMLQTFCDKKGIFMDKQEFITSLRRNLSGMEDYEYVNDTVSYYENYIETEVRKGETEENVLRMLGDPSLIAKSIKASKEEITFVDRDETEEFRRTAQKAEKRISWLMKLLSLPSWVLKLGFWVVVIGLFALTGFIIVKIWPVFVVLIVIYVFYKFIRDNFVG